MRDCSEPTPAARHSLPRPTLGPYRYVRWRWRVLFAIIDFLGDVLFAAGRAMRRLLHPGRRTTAPAADPRRILLVQLDHLGDAIISTVMLAALRRRYPQARIEVLASAWNREVFQSAAEVDRVYVSRVNRFARGPRLPLAWIASTFWWGLVLRRRKIDLGIDVRGEFPLALLLWLTGARRRLGWNCGGGRFLLTDSPAFVPGRPEVASRWAQLAELGIAAPQSGRSGEPRFHAGDEARQMVRRELAQLAREHPAAERRVVVHVGAGTPAKQWPIEHWQALLSRLVTRYAAQVVLVGSATDRIIARAILGPGGWPGVVDWTGRLRLVELAALLEESDLLVGADSAPAHLAAAVAAPVVVLFSGTNDPGQWQPAGDRVCVIRHEVACQPCHRQRCRFEGHPCLRRLSPDRVLAAIEQLLSREKGDRPPLPRRKGDSHHLP